MGRFSELAVRLKLLGRLGGREEGYFSFSYWSKTHSFRKVFQPIEIYMQVEVENFSCIINWAASNEAYYISLRTSFLKSISFLKVPQKEEGTTKPPKCSSDHSGLVLMKIRKSVILTLPVPFSPVKKIFHTTCYNLSFVLKCQTELEFWWFYCFMF